jgi:hypothetical protein
LLKQLVLEWRSLFLFSFFLGNGFSSSDDETPAVATVAVDAAFGE